MTELVHPQVLVTAARSLINVPWVHQGRSRKGVDCIGLPDLALRLCGIDFGQCVGGLPRNYGRTPKQRLFDKVREVLAPAPDLVTGCLLFFQFPEDVLPRHFGIYTEKETVIHAHGMWKAVKEHGYRGQWVKCTNSRWLLPRIDYGAL